MGPNALALILRDARFKCRSGVRQEDTRPVRLLETTQELGTGVAWIHFSDPAATHHRLAIGLMAGFRAARPCYPAARRGHQTRAWLRALPAFPERFSRFLSGAEQAAGNPTEATVWGIAILAGTLGAGWHRTP